MGVVLALLLINNKYEYDQNKHHERGINCPWWRDREVVDEHRGWVTKESFTH